MTVILLLIVAVVAAGSVVWLVTYANIIRTIGGHTWSPRLLICRLLIPIDIAVTSILILGPMFTGIYGIQSFVCGVFIGAGLSIGVAFTRRVMVPKWTIKYQELKMQGFVVV